jgi:hypothetical protein
MAKCPTSFAKIATLCNFVVSSQVLEDKREFRQRQMTMNRISRLDAKLIIERSNMMPKRLILLGLLTILAAGCASTSPDPDMYIRQMNMPYWESSQLTAPPSHTVASLPPAESVVALNGL